MKRLYTNPNRLVDQYSSQIQNLKAQHLRLIQSLQQNLKFDVPAQLIAAFQPRSMAGQPPTMVTEFVPPQLQPRFFRGRPGMIGPRGSNGSLPGMQDPFQATREQRKQMQERMQKQMQDMRNRMRSRRGGAPGSVLPN